jgi:hypothetical protein
LNFFACKGKKKGRPNTKKRGLFGQAKRGKRKDRQIGGEREREGKKKKKKKEKIKNNQ